MSFLITEIAQAEKVLASTWKTKKISYTVNIMTADGLATQGSLCRQAISSHGFDLV